MISECSATTDSPKRMSRVRVSGYVATRILLGTVLAAAGVLKGYELTSDPVAGSNPLPPRWLLIGLVEFEWMLGLWLLAGLHPVATRRIAIACFSAFTCISLHRALTGASSCGCFGRVSLNPWFTFAFDLAAVAVLLRCRPATGRMPTVRSHPTRAAVGLALGAWIGIPGVVLMAHPVDDGLAVLRPGEWVGKCLPLLRNIDVGDELARGRWIVVLYHHDCPSCREAVPRYERLARNHATQPDTPRIALIEMPPYAPPGQAIAWPDSPCKLGRLDDSKGWLIRTPAEISLRDCIVEPKGRFDE